MKNVFVGLVAIGVMGTFAFAEAKPPVKKPKPTVRFDCGDWYLDVFANKDNPEYIEVSNCAWSMGYNCVMQKLARIESENGNLYSDGKMTSYGVIKIWNEGDKWKLLEGHICSSDREKIAVE